MLPRVKPPPLPDGQRKTCFGKLSSLSCFTGFPLPPCGWKLDILNQVDVVLTQAGLQMKNILHSFYFLFFFLGYFTASSAICVAVVEATPEGGRRS